jgi:hypothetical protein
MQLEGEPIVSEHNEELIQVCSVKCGKVELLGRSAVHFLKDLVVAAECERQERMVKRFQFVTPTPLPGPLCFARAEAKKTEVTEIPKKEYYTKKLGRFRDKLGATVERIKKSSRRRKRQTASRNQ